MYPRKILDDLRDGFLTPAEYNLYMYVRHCASPYGITHTSLLSLSNHIGRNENYTTKLLLSLKKKGFLYYEKRVGRKGDFAVHFPDFITPDRVVTSIPSPSKVRESSESSPNSHTESPRSITSKAQSIAKIHENLNLTVRGSYIETDTNNKTELSENIRGAISSYSPQDYRDELCKRIAIELGEKSMDRILLTRREYGFKLIEKTWEAYLEEKAKKRELPDKVSLFQSILHQLKRAELKPKKEGL